MFKISTPVPEFNGQVAGVWFTAGEAETDNESAVAYFRRHGYDVAEVATAPRKPKPKPAPKPTPEPTPDAPPTDPEPEQTPTPEPDPEPTPSAPPAEKPPGRSRSRG
ncbi:hypothetical protein ACFQ61_02130 [Streptomyces sp. NPDC056500]|uniref:hypothetical protein n=1 Tax=Streptomyces sp. NPDC056500 TaxID=3345840 RepID=UPI0036CBE2D8